MPCRDGGPECGVEHGTWYQIKIDELTRLLCTSCQVLERQVIPFPNDLRVWWIEHQTADKIREEREVQTARQALVGAEERLALAKRQLAIEEAKVWAKKGKT